jgi:acetyl-CoA acetyltransferase
MSGAGVDLAASAIGAGRCRAVALVYGNDGGSARATYGGAGEGYGTAASLTLPYGMTSPGAFYALMLQRHRHLYGTTEEQLATVATTFRHHASLNPGAVMRTPLSREDYLASRYIVEPMHLFDYCLINDGGVALILTSAERARDLRKPPVYIAGMARADDYRNASTCPDDFWYAALQQCAERVYPIAGVERKDVDVLQVYDNFTPTVVFSLEGLGFCPQGEGGRFVEGGRLQLGGELPSNTSGGHLSESYMQGWGLNVEAVRQLRGECGPRQVADCEVAQFLCATPCAVSIIYTR